MSYGRLISSSVKLTRLPLEESGNPLVATVLFIDLGLGKGSDIGFKILRVSFFIMASSPSPTLQNTSDAI